MPMSNYAAGKVLEHIVGKTSWTMPTAYVSLHTGDPGYTGSSEVTGSGYGRVATSGSTWNTAGTDRTIENASAIEFPQATGDWGTVSHFGLWDASSSGNFLGGGALTTSKQIQNGDTARFTAGNLVIKIDVP